MLTGLKGVLNIPYPGHFAPTVQTRAHKSLSPIFKEYDKTIFSRDSGTYSQLPTFSKADSDNFYNHWHLHLSGVYIYAVIKVLKHTETINCSNT